MSSISRFFIDRPVLAWVIGIIVMLVGTVSLFKMPISQYPPIAAPAVNITVSDPGASAETVNNTVVQPILQQMFGLDHLEYVTSTSYGNGTMLIDLTFEQGTNPDIAQVQVQNRLQVVQPQLPQEVVSQGISVLKEQASFMMVLSFSCKDGSLSDADIADYVASNIQDPISRVSGVGDHQLFGAEYAMRIWLDPDKLYNYNLNISDVENALKEQNIQLPAGELGGLPANKNAKINATIIGPRRLSDVKQFKQILIKVNQDNSRVTLGDIAKIELGPQSFNISASENNYPAAGLGLKLAPGANQLETENAVLAKINELSEYFPPGLSYGIPMDTKPYITHSIEEVVETLIIAIILVVLVMMVFLQNLRATIVPTLAIPVVLLGTFGMLSAMGYTLNTLTMLALVLAVGLLVDDAIVVVENVERVMNEEKLSPKAATRKSMEEISGALFGIVMVLTAVFLPMAFFGGSVGIIYRQFSITIVVAMWLSLGVALILTPAMCATLLKPHTHSTVQGRGLFGKIQTLFQKAGARFNQFFDALTAEYIKGVEKVLQHWKASFSIFCVLAVSATLLFCKLPSGFLPDEDQGKIFGMIQLRSNGTQDKVVEITRDLSDWVLKTYSVNINSVFAMNGFSFAGQGQNNGAFFINLAPWDERPRQDQSAQTIAMGIMQHFWEDPRARVFAFSPPAVQELGNATGFDLELVNEGNLTREEFLARRDDILMRAAQDPLLTSVRPNGMEDAAQYVFEVDRGKANAMGVSNEDINDTISGALGSIYVNQFLRNNRVKQVYIQAEPSARMNERDLKRWYIRNHTGTMVPLNAFTSGHWITGPQKLENYNGLPSFEINGEPASGVSSGQAMAEMVKLVKETPGGGVGYAWVNLSYEQVSAGGSTLPLYALASIIIFLCLAGLYESWTIPVAVLLVLPLGVLGAVSFSMGRGYANDIYFQIGVLTTVALSVKNAILIVEFAYEYYNKGTSLADAAMRAAQQRLRPILMTSIAFLCGVLPLAIAVGAGAGARRAIGTCVVGGMLSATLFAVYFVPLFFVEVLRFFKVKPVGEDGEC
ncbi:efflux RND transporter permease subunit [Acetobacteraceae bacterium]|nr:efflux RND transporter permease subunit [Acetobacteraceae bacterium]